MVTSPRLKALEPPLMAVLTTALPFAALESDPSQARYLISTGPDELVLKLSLGTKRILWRGLPPSSNLEKFADTAVAASKSVKVVPPLVENCHSPLVLSTDVMATPVAKVPEMVPLWFPAPSSTSVAAAALRKVETASPLLVAGSSRMVVTVSYTHLRAHET